MQPVHSDLLVCRDAAAVAEEVASRFACAARQAVARRGRFDVAIPGGSSPRGAFQLLAREDLASEIPWNSVYVYFTDERCVPPDHEESNYRLADDLLLSRVPIPKANVHRFAGELPPIEAAAHYEQLILRGMGEEPCFDLVLLGMGDDCHTASLFPDSPALDEARHVAAANFVAKLGTHRLTLTIPAINGARSVIVLALGRAKAATVARALQDKVNERTCPVRAVRPRDGRLLWIIDQDAASNLR